MRSHHNRSITDSEVSLHPTSDTVWVSRRRGFNFEFRLSSGVAKIRVATTLEFNRMSIFKLYL